MSVSGDRIEMIVDAKSMVQPGPREVMMLSETTTLSIRTFAPRSSGSKLG